MQRLLSSVTETGSSAAFITEEMCMAILAFYPLGNADCCRIDLDCGKKILFDYANTHNPEDDNDRRCDLEQELRDELDAADRDYFDVVAFTHLDEDHYKRATEFFWLQHAKKYQDSDRIKIDTMWVPAAFITERNLDSQEARILQAEARHRFKEGSGIRVFSRPERLRQWCEDNEVDFQKRQHLITDAGQLAPEFDKGSHGVEFFVHSPFAKRLNEDEVEDRNEDSLVMHATFLCEGVETRVFLMGDAPHCVLADIVDITQNKGRHERLQWDVTKLPHHCSYLSLGPEKGKDKTEPVRQVRELYETYGQSNAILVSTSKPIPKKGTQQDDDDMPPHRQAANYYKQDVVDYPADQFKVTMEHPSESSPMPLVIEIDGAKATVRKRAAAATVVAPSVRAPRAG